MAGFQLTLACRDYDHTRALMDGTVPVEGVELKYLAVAPPSAIFLRMLRHEEFDACEMSLSNYLIALDHKDRRFVGIPVFPSRVFRHSNIWINSKGAISEPRDLIGKRVGIPDYSMTALLFVRGMLQHQYGVAPEDIHWLRSRSEHVPIKVPPAIRIDNIPPDQTLDGLLEDGKIDAMVSTSLPQTVRNGSTRIKRLFPDVRQAEAAYFRQTGIFPIMHLIVIRRAIYEKHPWIAQTLYKAFCEAKDLCLRELYDTNVLRISLPWTAAEYEEIRELMTDDYWPYGLAPNRGNLETLHGYLHEQGLIKQRLDLDALFAPQTLESFKI